MTTEKQFPALSDFQITETMIEYGGGFDCRLGHLFRYADDDNQAKLKLTFADLWCQYAAMTARCPECGRTEIVSRDHDGRTGGVHECDFYQCEFCDHQWGHT
jgi:predicted RNA-binding Zn-ribbon protein involved in translation (DUF1610 family)